MSIKDNYSWKDLIKIADDKKTIKNIMRLKSIIAISDFRFLFNLISKFNVPNDIKALEEYQEKQHDLGAWVPGIYPDQFLDEELTVPNNYINKIKLILELVNQREKNYKAIKALGEYNLSFENNKLNFVEINPDYPDNWNLNIDLSVLSNTINFLKDDKIKLGKAKNIANLEGNQEMLRHRKNLGYLPEPITDTEDLIELLIWATSKKPEDIIWKWLNPVNIFELADIYNNISAYENLMRDIQNNSELITNKILNEINKYIDIHLDFDETFSLTIGFAIRGWATDNRFGVNIENIKDDYKKLIAGIGHELFHRLQTRICLTESQQQNFSELVNGNYKDERDNKFYKVLSYIMLEGTAEFITEQFLETSRKDLEKKAIEGFGLLKEIFEVIYIEGNLNKVDELLAKGLKSNGVFYSLGEYLTKLLVDSKDEAYLGVILKKGVENFFIEGLCLTENLNNNKLFLKIKELQNEL